MKYHHLGIPTRDHHDGEHYMAEHKVYVSGYETSPYRIEWMRFEEGSPVPELVRTVPHVAFEVEDLNDVLRGKQILIPPNSPSKGVTVAFVVDNGAPVEFLEINKGLTGSKENAE
jgi:hypothetical protein